MEKRVRASVICRVKESLLVVKLQDPSSGRIYRLPPGGKIESGESAVQAAVRETREETGYTVEVDPNSELTVDYLFLWNGQEVDCQTHFFRGNLSEIPLRSPLPEPFHLGVEWMDLAEVDTELNYHPLLKSTLRRLLF